MFDEDDRVMLALKQAEVHVLALATGDDTD